MPGSGKILPGMPKFWVKKKSKAGNWENESEIQGWKSKDKIQG